MTYGRSACFLIRPSGALRFGSHADDLTAAEPFPGSDTLFGALAWAVAARDGEDAVGSWVQRFVAGSPPFLLSSALPFDESTSTPLLPRPQRRRKADIAGEINRKLLKRAEYVDPGALAWFGGANTGTPVANGRLLVSGSGPLAARGWVTTPVPGVTVDRAASSSSVYSVAVTHYRVSLAVYALAEDESELEALGSLMDVLSLTGIGGRRSRGAGQFSWERIECRVRLAASPSGAAVSLVWPRPDELEGHALSPPEDLGYRITRRQGWIGSQAWSSERSRTVAMIAEGSYLRPDLGVPVGGMVDVTPAERRGRHPVYRYGFGLFLDEGIS